MRKFIIVFLVFFSVFLSGCSFLEDVNQSLDYANNASEYINKWNEFGNEVPQLLEKATSNADVKAELETQLNTMLAEIKQFNQLQYPQVAENVHQKIVAKNEQLKQVIENAMTNGEIAVKKLENSELTKLINDITAFQNLVKDLGL